MSFLNDRVFDNGLSVLTSEANKLTICNAEPATYTEANTTFALGAKLAPTISSPSARTPSGRRVTVSAITDGSVSANGTASHYALVDTVNSRLLAANTLSATQVVTSGNTFTLGAFDVGIPGV
ncbi:MAG: hypothetical protein ACK52I_17010 [Pseudomonadota bacterium]|jgi:hypothetical protein